MQPQCKANRQDGEPCQSWAVGASGYCTMHNPARRDTNRATQRAGGEARSAARRAAKAWAAIGDVVSPDQLPAILRACLFSVRDGELEPAQASAIAALAKASVALAQDLEMEDRIAALEARAEITRDSTLRRVK